MNFRILVLMNSNTAQIIVFTKVFGKSENSFDKLEFSDRFGSCFFFEGEGGAFLPNCSNMVFFSSSRYFFATLDFLFILSSSLSLPFSHTRSHSHSLFSASIYLYKSWIPFLSSHSKPRSETGALINIFKSKPSLMNSLPD